MYEYQTTGVLTNSGKQRRAVWSFLNCLFTVLMITAWVVSKIYIQAPNVCLMCNSLSSSQKKGRSKVQKKTFAPFCYFVIFYFHFVPQLPVLLWFRSLELHSKAFKSTWLWLVVEDKKGWNSPHGLVAFFFWMVEQANLRTNE